MMKVFVSLAFLSAIAYASIPQERALFNQFKSDFGKLYQNEVEEEMRFEIFSQNYRKVQEHNLSGKYSWTKGINQFSDLTKEEFNVRLGYKKTGFMPNMVRTISKNIDITQLPKSVDWSEKGATTPVKDQGQCGSCWAFATTEQIESYAFITNKTLRVLSAQQITSCTPDSLGCGGTGGCTGGVPQLGFTYTNLEGITSDKDYPYKSGKSGVGGQCTYNPKKTLPVATVSGYEALPTNDYEAVMHHLATVGPLTIVGWAVPWQDYSGGVFDGCSFQENIQLDHAIQLVGYGTDPKHGDFWKVRNSWSDNWGEKGFIRLKRNTTPKCGYDSQDVIGCKTNWDHKVQVCGQCGILFNPSYPIDAYLL